VTAAPDDALRARGLAVGHRGRVVAAGIDFALPRGGCLAVVGPNGSGKTTLLRTVLGILPPVAGALERPAPFLPGYVPQRDRIDPVFPFRAREVVEMAAVPEAWIPWTRRRDRRERARAALDRVAMAAHAETPLRELSGGQRQRVLVARALAAGPTFLALDEPATGMDADAEEGLFALLHSLRRDDGITVAVVTHDEERVVREATLVLRLRAGSARCEGAAA
jgi:ABC-type Mn2+/Zn2+ transport system ATPase subunit